MPRTFSPGGYACSYNNVVSLDTAEFGNCASSSANSAPSFGPRTLVCVSLSETSRAYYEPTMLGYNDGRIVGSSYIGETSFQLLYPSNSELKQCRRLNGPYGLHNP